MKIDSFGERMKQYEQAEAGRCLMPRLPVIARLDGRGFHRWTEDLERPYDQRLSDLMTDSTKHLVEQTGARIGYTQSDEISLVFHSDSETDWSIFFDGKIHKMASILASMLTAYFNHVCERHFRAERALAMFDCRVWNVPSKVEAVNAVLWREHDATKNSISMAAQAKFKHAELQGKNGSEMQEMLFKHHGINWNSYPAFFKRGTYVARRKVVRSFTAEEALAIPEKFRPAIGDKIERTETRILDLPPMGRIVNRTEVVFDGAEPEIESENS